MALDKRRLKREIETDRRAAARDKVRELRGRIQLARLERKARVSAIRLQCAQAREKLRAVCLSRRERAALEGARLVEQRKAELGEQYAYEKIIRSGDRQGVKGTVRKATAAERAAESDDEVRANIPRELLSAFEKHRRQFKETARRTRTEAFLEWAEANPDEIWALQNEQAEQDIKAMVREHNRHARAVGAAELDDVPF
jgi:hypothetical protein